MAGGAVFKLGSFGNFCVFNQRDAGLHFLTTDGHGRRPPSSDPPWPGLRRDMEATMAMSILSSPATLTGAEEKKTGPSRFRPDFLTRLRQSPFAKATAGQELRRGKQSQGFFKTCA